MNNSSDTKNIWRREEIESPCINVCVIDETHGHCLGCWRSRYEIAGWSQKTPEDRKNIMQSLPERSKQFKPKRKGGRQKPSI